MIQSDQGRRSALKMIGAGLAALGGFLWGILPARVRAAVNDLFPTRTVDKDEYTFDPASGEVLWNSGKREPYLLSMEGLVEAPVKLSYKDLRALPQVARTVDFHCVEGWDVNDIPWSGVSFAELFRKVKLKKEATHAVFHSLGHTNGGLVGGLDHYVESFPIKDLLRPELDYMLALDLEGLPLPKDRGAPARVVCPFDLSYKSIKFVTRVEFTDHAVAGWWTRANPVYPVNAPVPAGRLRVRDPRRG